MAQVYGRLKVPMTMEVAHRLLTEPGAIDAKKVSTLPAVSPIGGTYYLYRYSEVSMRKDWRADGYLFLNKGNPKYFPLGTKELRRSLYHIRLGGLRDSDKRFARYSFETPNAEKPPIYVIVQYIGMCN